MFAVTFTLQSPSSATPNRSTTALAIAQPPHATTKAIFHSATTNAFHRETLLTQLQLPLRQLQSVCVLRGVLRLSLDASAGVTLDPSMPLDDMQIFGRFLTVDLALDDSEHNSVPQKTGRSSVTDPNNQPLVPRAVQTTGAQQTTNSSTPDGLSVQKDESVPKSSPIQTAAQSKIQTAMSAHATCVSPTQPHPSSVPTQCTQHHQLEEQSRAEADDEIQPRSSHQLPATKRHKPSEHVAETRDEIDKALSHVQQSVSTGRNQRRRQHADSPVVPEQTTSTVHYAKAQKDRQLQRPQIAQSNTQQQKRLTTHSLPAVSDQRKHQSADSRIIPNQTTSRLHCSPSRKDRQPQVAQSNTREQQILAPARHQQDRNFDIQQATKATVPEQPSLTPIRPSLPLQNHRSHRPSVVDSSVLGQTCTRLGKPEPALMTMTKEENIPVITSDQITPQKNAKAVVSDPFISQCLPHSQNDSEVPMMISPITPASDRPEPPATRINAMQMTQPTASQTGTQSRENVPMPEPECPSNCSSDLGHNDLSWLTIPPPNIKRFALTVNEPPRHQPPLPPASEQTRVVEPDAGDGYDDSSDCVQTNARDPNQSDNTKQPSNLKDNLSPRRAVVRMSLIPNKPVTRQQHARAELARQQNVALLGARGRAIVPGSSSGSKQSEPLATRSPRPLHLTKMIDRSNAITVRLQSTRNNQTWLGAPRMSSLRLRACQDAINVEPRPRQNEANTAWEMFQRHLERNPQPERKKRKRRDYWDEYENAVILELLEQYGHAQTKTVIDLSFEQLRPRRTRRQCSRHIRYLLHSVPDKTLGTRYKKKWSQLENAAFFVVEQKTHFSDKQRVDILFRKLGPRRSWNDCRVHLMDRRTSKAIQRYQKIGKHERGATDCGIDA